MDHPHISYGPRSSCQPYLPATLRLVRILHLSAQISMPEGRAGKGSPYILYYPGIQLLSSISYPPIFGDWGQLRHCIPLATPLSQWHVSRKILHYTQYGYSYDFINVIIITRTSTLQTWCSSRLFCMCHSAGAGSRDSFVKVG